MRSVATATIAVAALPFTFIVTRVALENKILDDEKIAGNNVNVLSWQIFLGNRLDTGYSILTRLLFVKQYSYA